MTHKNTNIVMSFKISYVISPLVFMPVLFYPPLVFTEKIPFSLRVMLFVFLSMYLILATKRISKNDVVIIVVLLFLSVFSLAIAPDLNGLRTAASTILTLVFAWALSRSVRYNRRVKENLIKFYVGFFLVMPICSLASVIFFLTFGELNLFNINAGQPGSYSFTPFGSVLGKIFFGQSVYRSFSFFQEPVYPALFYAANIFLVAPHFKVSSRFFLAVNIVGGILTFSYLFVILSFLLFSIKRLGSISLKSGLYLLLAVSFSIVLSQVDIFSASSLSDRINRINNYFISLENLSIIQFMFGNGFAQETGFNRGFSAGLFTTLYESGIFGVAAIVVFFGALSGRKYCMFILFFVSLLVFEPVKLPLFWVLVAVLTVLLHNKHSEKSVITPRQNLLNPYKKLAV